MTKDVNVIMDKVAELLARSSLEPGIREINELTRLSVEARMISQACFDMEPPAITTQASHCRIP